MLEQLGNIMETVKKIQQQIQNVQEDLRKELITVSSGDVLKVTINGQQELTAIEINPKYLAAEHASLLENLLVATINNAIVKSRNINQEAMSKLAADMNLPKIPGLF